MGSESLSVVIAYAGETEYIEEMIRSVLSNTGISEILVGVDLSRTNERDAQIIWNPWIELAETKKIKLELHFSSIPGPAAVRNLAIRNANSKIILPVDSDDRISTNYVRLIIDAYRENHNIGIVYGKAELFGNAKGDWGLPSFSMTGIVLENCIFATSGFRKEDWEKVGGYDEELIFGQEDWDLWLKIIGLGREVFFLDEVIFYYRIRSNSRSVAFRGMWQQVIWTYDRICKNNQILMASQIESIYHRRIQLELENSTFKNVSKGFFVASLRKFPSLRKFSSSRLAKKIQEVLIK